MLPLRTLLYLILTAFILPVTGQNTCTYLDLVQSLSHGCATRSRFCERLLAPTPTARTSTYSYTYLTSRTSTYTYSYPTTIYTTKYTATLLKTKTLTKTKALRTTTVSGCNSLATCGQVTAVPTAPMLQACSCIRGLKTVITRTYTGASSVTYSYKYASTVTGRVKRTLTTTEYPTKTKTIPVETVYECASVAPPRTCNNQNHQFARYVLTKKDLKSRPEDWDLDYYKTRKPLLNGTSPQIGLIARNYNDEAAGIADITDYSCTNTYLNDRAYLYAPETGTYTFQIPAFGQAAYLWIGDLAYSGYNVTNAFLSATATNNIYGEGPFNRKFLTAGTYYPIRYAYRCNTTYFDFFQNIIKPDGNYLFGQYSKLVNDYNPYFYYSYNYGYFDLDDPSSRARTLVVNSSYIVQHGCGADRKLAPPFPDWGHES